MPIDLDHAVKVYAAFEQTVRQWTDGRCGPFCKTCRAVCCRAHFCDETRQSAFLARVAAHASPQSDYHAATGWLTPAGCGLKAGRPPVCYEFLCLRITTALDGDPLKRHALLAASMLMTHVGRRALGGRHLVTLTRRRDLARIRVERLMDRLDEAGAALAAAVDVFAGRRSGNPQAAFARIAPAPTG